MSLFNQNLPLIAGRTFDFDLTWQTKDENGAWEPVNLTGCTVELEIRKSTDDTLLVRCSSEAGNIKIPEPESGEILFHIAPEQTNDQDPNQWTDAIWEVVVTYPSLDKYSIFWGSATLQRRVVNSR